MRGRGQSILVMVGAIIHSRICDILLTEEIQSFFIRASKLLMRVIVLKLS